MVNVPVTVLGGLPVIADVWFSGPDYFGEYDSGCGGLFWMRSDGSKGKEVSQKVYDRLDNYWEADVTEQANDWLSISVPTHYADGREEGEYSETYLMLNPR